MHNRLIRRTVLSVRVATRVPLALLAATLVLLGCAGQDAPTRDPGAPGQVPEVSTATPATLPQAPIAATAADPCDVHREAFRAAMDTATGTCETDSDCGCFNPVVGEAGCGGITDRATTGALGAIEARFHADDCPWPHQCGPWSCQPECQHGRCRNAAAGGRTLP